MVDKIMIIVGFISFIYSMVYMVSAYFVDSYIMFYVRLIGGFVLMCLSGLLLALCLS